ncbi:hypothetical protein B0H14DRAFT_3461150 [Mycena olivaceomarginata]|nr:hypothetical protein B0H14DRAFT_3461150 [Mycena olivaceomarginata]
MARRYISAGPNVVVPILTSKVSSRQLSTIPYLSVYRDPKTGFYYELNSTQSGVWASAMAQGKTDENTPPVSKFFDAKQRIKTVPAIIAQAPAPAVPAAPTAPAVTGSSVSLTDLLFASVLSQFRQNKVGTISTTTAGQC